MAIDNAAAREELPGQMNLDQELGQIGFPEPTREPGTQEEIDQDWRPTLHGSTIDPTGKRDLSGVLFDPAVHTGSLKQDGRWRKKKNPEGVTEQIDHYKVAAAQFTNLFFSACQAFGGEEWAPVEIEKQTIEAACENYCRANTMIDMPPGVALALALFTYATPRFAKPVTKSRLEKLAAWARSKYFQWKI